MSLESNDASHAASGQPAVARAVLDGLEAQQTMHHQGIETYRQTAYTVLDMLPGDGAGDDDAPRTAGVDAHCDALHDVVERSWSVYGTLLADGFGLAGAAFDSSARLGASAAGPRPSTDLALEDIDGIGAAYASQLRELGIDSVADLARADPSIAEELDAIGVDVADWIEQAAALTSAD